MSSATKYLLEESQMPRAWYNIQADLPKALPPVLHPGTLQPVGPSDLAPLFPMELILQEVSQEREIEIPEPVREIYRLWRPAPLYRAHHSLPFRCRMSSDWLMQVLGGDSMNLSPDVYNSHRYTTLAKAVEQSKRCVRSSSSLM